MADKSVGSHICLKIADRHPHRSPITPQLCPVVWRHPPVERLLIMSRPMLVLLSVVIIGILGGLVVYDRATGPRLVGGCRIEPAAVCFGKDLSGADLTEANIPEITLSEARIEDAILVNANMPEAKLFRAVMNRSDLSGAELSGAVMAGAQLNSALLIGADLTGADLKYVDFTGADLTDAILLDADIEGAKFTDAVFVRTVMPDGSLRTDNL